LTEEGEALEASVGRFLARQRELREISLDQLAARTRIPRRSLERLESGCFDRECDGFVRGFVRTVAEALGLDPDEAVTRLLREPPAEEEAWSGDSAGRGWLARALAVVLALAALVLGLWGLRRMSASAPPEGSPVIYRRDAVRSLVDERGGPGALDAQAERSSGGEFGPGDSPAPID
jgi:cytoskeletal protein RodZ